MKKLTLPIFLLLLINVFSQQVPTVKLKDSSQLKLTSLKVDVEIVGNYATTTYDMMFYNGLDRTLEGELVFPLGQGQSVSRFAMDVNGELRDAVVVEKELARVAFESTVRQNIDPGLLEKTQGNNYKARIYPILPKKQKHIVISYEQQLYSLNNFQRYELPLGIKETLDDFSININVFGDGEFPKVINNPYQNFLFRKGDNVYEAALTKKNHTPSNAVIIQVPNKSNQEKLLSYQDYFYAYKVLAPNSRLKKKPKKITILWDASYSLAFRNIDKELKLLKSYVEHIKSLEIQFVSFSNTIHQYKVLAGNDTKWNVIENLIRNTNYDGGTSLDFLNELKLKSDEILLFTDGLANLGAFSLGYEKVIYTVNSTTSADHEILNDIATQSGGNYINLSRYSFFEALKMMKQETFQFLGVKHNKSVQEVYPKKNTNVIKDFTITGIFSEDTTIELLFGYQGKVTTRIPLPIKKSQGTKLVKRLWAKQKLLALSKNKKQNKEKIIVHAKRNHLISDYTSMLILDRIEDYVRYRIEPPKELREEYKERIKNIALEEANRLEELAERKEDLFSDYKSILDWYNKEYPKKEKQKKTVSNTISQNTSISTRNIPNTPADSISITNSVGSANTPDSISITNSTRSTNTNQVITQEMNPIGDVASSATLNPYKRIVTGTVVDSQGGPLPGVNIIVTNLTKGTLTDFDGMFAINAEENDVLRFSYVGFNTVEKIVRNVNNINVTLQQDMDELDEVVVVGYGIQKRSSITASLTSVSVEQSLQGRASGVSVSEQSGNDTIIRVRGAFSMSSANPLYVVDGILMEGNPMNDMSPDDIASVNVLKSSSTTAIYGSRAANGVIIVTTKKGEEINQDAINKFNNQINEKIALKSWNRDTPYIKILEKESTIESAYKKYLEIRDEYANVPTFYIDVADFFANKNETSKTITILTNLVEIELNNHELMKALAYKLEYFEQYSLAVMVYQKIVTLRPEEPQSYRDLALAYEKVGEIQKSFDLLYKLYDGQLLDRDEDERYYGIEQLAFVEMNRLVSLFGKKLILSNEQKGIFQEIPVDVRVVIDWNHNDTDIDLWVIDPMGEKTLYSNPESKIGGRISEDLTQGYGPEEFMLKNAIKGEYKVLVDYYSDTTQKISGPTVLKVTMWTNYGRKNELKKIAIIRLDKEEDEIEIGSLQFGNAL